MAISQNISGGPSHHVGIDLGTTNCAVSYLPTDSNGPVRTLEIPQVVRPGEVAGRPLLPSFTYLAGEGELPAGALDLPWAAGRDFAVGEFARQQGGLVPTRLVSSAKSWLSHAAVDRRAAILPWRSPEESRRISPVEASARYLGHLAEAWNLAHPGQPLGGQDIVLTVPASFDPEARELTLDAARQAGLGQVILLEEPQAAFYSWLESQGDNWRRSVRVGDLILVCDVGGGTTDFTLISVTENMGNLELSRLAVGNHILLGGDNMDLALAHAANQGLAAKGSRLDHSQFLQLVHAARAAKESMLSQADLASAKFHVQGRGTKLVAGGISGEIPRSLLDSILLDGFFPACGSGDEPRRQSSAGLQEAGLPYATDAAITRHLAAFLTQHRGGKRVSAVLFNGGVFKSRLLRERVLATLGGWFSGEPVRCLEAADLEVAVAHGAACYARARKQGGIRVRGGTARSFYVGVEIPAPAVPGFAPPIKALCVVPFGMEEGSESPVPNLELGLVVGEPVQFRFLGSNRRKDDSIGTAVEDWQEDIEELTPLSATLDSDAPPGTRVPVRLHSRVTEVGTLELSCQGVHDNRRWKLEFRVRENDQSTAT